MNECPVCGSPDVSSVTTLFDDRYGYPGSFPLLHCHKCTHSFLRAAFSSEQLGELYSKYYPRSSFDITNYRPAAQHGGFVTWLDGKKSAAFRWVPENVTVLDIGCGFGESLGYYKARGCEAWGVEADENISRVAKEYGYKVHVGLFDPSIYDADFFDYVTMSQVIEHVTDPVATLQGVARVLKPGGMAILSTPNADGLGAWLFGRRWINWHAPYHLQFFSISSMERAAAKAGLTLVETKTITSSEWLNYQWQHLATFPHQGEASPYWAPGRKKSGMQQFAVRMISLLHRSKINHLLTRLFDGLGIGDSRIYFLHKS